MTVGPSIRVVQPVTTEAFETLVAEALDGLPPELGALMQNVAVLVADWGESSDLLGLYDGIPLTDRDDYGGGGMALPDRITVYRLALCGMCGDLDELRHEIGVTVVYEVAHHFGIDDDRLHELGWA